MQYLCCFLVWLLFSVVATAQEATIAAASDLKFALDEVAKAYAAQTGRSVRISYGSSGNFVAQIAQGAPYDLFLSADESYVTELSKRGLTVDEGVLYAVGHVVLFVPKDSPVKADAGLQDLRVAIADGRLKKLAIANPEFAPYGRAAREVLQRTKLWDAVRDKLVFGENVSQAAQFAASGSAQAGIFALSLAMSPNFSNAGAYVILAPEWHAPLRQRMVLLERGADKARAFYDYMQQPAARAILSRYGFALPGD
ncbi:MAG TPA: molybdate ABC transporter substrate-binding protein [Burkholderiales bacterium]|nr:molybdate ABC transporter substrate-binding protein [Burkholderiales bacterium]